MRVISGTARGTKLYSLEGDTTRPTLDRVKESVFNILQTNIKESIFLDLFSGSGAIGIEAASRGAKKVFLCDKSKKAVEIINKNVEKTHLENKIKVYNLDYKECLKKFENTKIDLIYLDPPYKTNFIIESLNLIIELNLLHKDSIIVVETDDELIIEKIENLNVNVITKKKYGRAYILLVSKC